MEHKFFIGPKTLIIQGTFLFPARCLFCIQKRQSSFMPCLLIQSQES